MSNNDFQPGQPVDAGYPSRAQQVTDYMLAAPRDVVVIDLNRMGHRGPLIDYTRARDIDLEDAVMELVTRGLYSTDQPPLSTAEAQLSPLETTLREAESRTGPSGVRFVRPDGTAITVNPYQIVGIANLDDDSYPAKTVLFTPDGNGWIVVGERHEVQAMLWP